MTSDPVPCSAATDWLTRVFAKAEADHEALPEWARPIDYRHGSASDPCSCGECNNLRAHLVDTHRCNGAYLAQQPRPMLDGIHRGAHSCQRDGQCVLPLDHEGDCDWGDDDVC